MEEGEGDERSSFYPKTHAKELYCLSEADLSPLSPKEKRNPYVRNGSTMKLYKQSELERLAVEKWGSLDGLEEEKQKRIAKKEQRALALAKAKSPDPEEAEEDGLNTTGPSTSAGQVLGASTPAASPSSEQGDLHELIKERIRPLRAGGSAASASGQAVVYWMRNAVRDHENPALDVSRAEATRRGLPLIVVSYLLASHTYPTHRRYKFLLEGLRDVQAGLQAQGIPHYIYVEGYSRHKDTGEETGSSNANASPGWQAVMAVARHAAVLITEEMPTPPYAQWLQDVADQAPPHTAVWAVDCSCVVPARISPRPYEKAYAFRSNLADKRKHRIAHLPYPNPKARLANAADSQQRPLDPPEWLPWESLDLTQPEVDIPGILNHCPGFDANVPGVQHMPGGQRAGYARWEAFKKKGLSQYAARRNLAMLREGVSRMSAYHHFGMVSPFRVARDALAAGSNGARKFADEFLTWRELSYAFCFHHWRILESFEVLPKWAQKTLRAHQGDRREIKSQQQLEQGTTGDEIWDALQHQLNITGELHNNVRMTWGKALLPWTLDPETALKETCHLNHKYALDGCDPCSYGGILWCFGQFDGPKGSESTPIFGSLRNRPTHLLSRKLNAARFRDLPLDVAAKASLAAEELAGKGGDIRTMFSKATQPSAGTSAAENEPPSISAGYEQAPRDSTTATARGSGVQEALAEASEHAAEASRGRASVARASATTPAEAQKRKGDSQPSIEQFFARKPAKAKKPAK